ERRRDADRRRPARHRAGPEAEPGDDAEHPPEPGVRLPLQHPRRADRGGHPLPVLRPVTQSDDRQRRDDLQLRLRNLQRLATPEARTLRLAVEQGWGNRAFRAIPRDSGTHIADTSDTRRAGLMRQAEEDLAMARGTGALKTALAGLALACGS